jgi:hypothetical protein
MYIPNPAQSIINGVKTLKNRVRRYFRGKREYMLMTKTQSNNLLKLFEVFNIDEPYNGNHYRLTEYNGNFNLINERFIRIITSILSLCGVMNNIQLRVQLPDNERLPPYYYVTSSFKNDFLKDKRQRIVYLQLANGITIAKINVSFTGQIIIRLHKTNIRDIVNTSPDFNKDNFNNAFTTLIYNVYTPSSTFKMNVVQFKFFNLSFSTFKNANKEGSNTTVRLTNK